MTQRDREPPAKPAQPEGGSASSLEPDPEWEAMEAMMDRIARMPVKIDKADVPVATGYANAAHAVGPITLHEGIETQPPQARVIIGEQVLPTQVMPRRLDKDTSAVRWNRRTAIVAAVGGAGLLAAAVTFWVVLSRSREGAASVDSSMPSSSVAAARPVHVEPAQAPSPMGATSPGAPSPSPSAAPPTPLPVASTPAPSIPAATTSVASAAVAVLPSSTPPTPSLTANSGTISPSRPRLGQHSPSHTASPSPGSKPASTAPRNPALQPKPTPADHADRVF